MSLIRLGIALDYPIKWSFERILRDLIQNFFDSIGYKNFGKEFVYHYERNRKNGKFDIIMKTKEHPFSYEWLTCIGGSTKTGSRGMGYIGQYGEGFKMCMLCLMKLGIKDVTMHSQDWSIRPTVYEEKIEGKAVQMLGYEYERMEDDGETVLWMNGVNEEQEQVISEGLLHFFYPENPLLGEKISEAENYAVYGRSSRPIPCRQYLYDFRGILYSDFLARGRLPFPVIILIRGNTYFTDSRKRRNFSADEVWELLYVVAKRFDAETSYALLIRLKSYWNDLPEGPNDWSTWYYLICQLVRNISKSEKHAERFQREYRDLAYIERKGPDKRHNQVIEEARIWTRENSEKKLVNPIFRLLGAEPMIERYLDVRDQGYADPDHVQQKRIRLLFEVVEKVVPYKLYDERPETVIGSGGGRNPDPLQFASRSFDSSQENRHRKYRIYRIVLQPEDLGDEAFYPTFVKIADILLHTYGASRSATLNALLTYLGGWIAEKHELLEKAESSWREIGTLIYE